MGSFREMNQEQGKLRGRLFSSNLQMSSELEQCDGGRGAGLSRAVPAWTPPGMQGLHEHGREGMHKKTGLLTLQGLLQPRNSVYHLVLSWTDFLKVRRRVMNEQTPNLAARFWLDVTQIHFSVTTTLENRAFAQNVVSLKIFPTELDSFSLLTYDTAMQLLQRTTVFLQSTDYFKCRRVLLIYPPFSCWLSQWIQGSRTSPPNSVLCQVWTELSLNSWVLSVLAPGQPTPQDGTAPISSTGLLPDGYLHAPLFLVNPSALPVPLLPFTCLFLNDLKLSLRVTLSVPKLLTVTSPSSFRDTHTQVHVCIPPASLCQLPRRLPVGLITY